MKILVCIDGSQEAERAAHLIHSLGVTKLAQITILAVAKSAGEQAALTASMDRIEAMLGAEASQIARNLRIGDPAVEIVEQASRGGHDLVVVPRHGHRRFPSLKLETTTKRLARLIPSHLLLAKNVPEKVQKILVCSGAEAPSEETVRIAALFTSGSDAKIGLLHVMSQVALRADSPSEDLEETAEEAIERHTYEGEHFEEAIQLMRELGVKTEIEPILRHGLVVDEIVAELKRNNYDLLVVGSHYRPAMTRWMDVLLEDVAGNLISRAPCSSLVIHHPPAPQDVSSS